MKKEIELVGNKLSMWLFSSNVLSCEKPQEMYQLTSGENFMLYTVSTLNFHCVHWTCTIITIDSFDNLGLSCQGWTNGSMCNNSTSLKIG